jgi:hypothetical protein
MVGNVMKQGKERDLTCGSYRSPKRADMLRSGLLSGRHETMTKGNNSEVFRNFL